MTTESSSVFVTVRVRPFLAWEDTACCTATVQDSATISVLDVPALIPGSAAAGPAGGGGHTNSVVGGDANSGGPSSSSCFSGGGGGNTGRSVAFSTPSALDTLRHSFSFDKIFWSVAPTVLPFPPLSVLEALHGSDADGATHRISVPGLVRPTSAQIALLTQHSTITKYLPCFAAPPVYDDQQRVYDFIGPRMHDAVMSGFNACLFAYGQTGSGKSYSMIGPTEALSAAVANAKGAALSTRGGSTPSTSATTSTTIASAERGIMPRLFTDLFQRMREEREKDASVTFTVEASFLEIYCEKVRDLLAIAALSASSSASSFKASASAGGSLRIRQHPSQGPYVEGLTHVKVRDEESVLRHLLNGLRDRATAGTNMNEHSSRSHAILQLQVTKVLADTDENTGTVVTRTRISKATMVDLAGSERVSQSGVSGDRFEEAKNINLSLSTLGRVIQQLSEKQSGKHVIPAYRDSVLTWLLSDSLGGNSKTIMLATVAPSAYCYQQTLNTLRFAGVAKKVINVASVNEDRHFQQLIAELRQQIVRLTLQLESGKAAEVHLEKIEALKHEKEELLRVNDALSAKVVAAADTTVLQALRKRVKELESENAQLREEGQSLQERLLSSTSTLRDELAQQRTELIRVRETLSKKEAELTEWRNRYRALVLSTTSPMMITTTTPTPGGYAVKRAAPTAVGAHAGGGSGVSASEAAAAAASATTAPTESTEEMVSAKEAQRAQQKLQEEVRQLKAKLLKGTQASAAAQRAQQEIADTHKETSTALDEYKVRYEESTRQLDLLHERMQSTMSLLETTQCELAAIKMGSAKESAQSRAVEDALEATNAANTTATAQLHQARTDYLGEKQRNVELLLRVAQVEQERSALKRTVAERAADTCELEQLLLEETENAERYYVRMRYHRYRNELMQRFIAQLQHLQRFTGQRAQRAPAAGTESSAVLSGQLSSDAARLPHADGGDGLEGGVSSQDAGRVPSQHGATTARARATVSEKHAAEAEAETARVLSVQLLYACQSEEAQDRAAVELECMHGVLRFFSQRGRLRQLAASALAEKLGEAEESQRTLREELVFYKQKVEAAETEYEEEVSRHQTDTAALQVAVMDRLRLDRKVAALEEVNSELEGVRDSLISKVASLQEQLRSWQGRCAEAERVAAEVQDLFLPGSSSTVLSSPLDGGAAGAKEGDDAQQQQLPLQSASAAVQLDKAALTNKARAAQTALEAKAALEQQCEDYRVELGALRAQLEQIKSERQDAAAQLARYEQTLQQSESRHSESSVQLLHEISTITRDYESRIKQQQTMMHTLRHALEEETAMADLCRQSAQRAEAARHTQEEELITARESCEELRRQEELVSHRYLTLQSELDQLRLRYNALERRLMEWQEKEPELYLLLEKGLEDDSTTWLGKVRSEKLRLQKQRSEARRLNSELLEHVRDGNTRLRDVRRQLTDVSLGEESHQDPTVVVKTPLSEDDEDEEELDRRERKRSDRRFSQLR
ncbi:putative Kinesin [Leptomonas pyrrhocoris]|uniref:Putative Kinesin n=1 Tax=Leptomonas pyrrhocoris TaxID=157538 RepID=A0A0M9G9T3_LEPPY|nr:putative Kinesin [Leptomonas pyrrhocoris]KPA85727.1 putative Kinesin [Leptomonas pyrrhocoris]|eukprot:XP_015664166.1 putative Kinesin [Leptomonas pyrrhocoris]